MSSSSTEILIAKSKALLVAVDSHFPNEPFLRAEADALYDALAMVDAELDAAVDAKIQSDEEAFERQYAGEHPNDDYLGRP